MQPEIPEGHIEWLVNRLHVSTPDREVERLMRSRIADGTSALTSDAIVKYALKVHHSNQRLYNDVMGGV